MTQTAIAYNRSVNTGSMPDRIRRLPISPKGFPVPWFVTWFRDGKPCADGEGEPDFRVIDPKKMRRAMDNNLCWVCGSPGGAYKAHVIGPMCAVDKIISEPSATRDCAIWSACNCPFLANPRMVRNAKNMQDGLQDAAGVPLARNPGVVCVWISKTVQPFRPPGGGILFSLGRPIETLWFCEGRRATRKEVLAAIDSGYPTLEEMAREEGSEALKALATQREVAMALIPD